MRFSKKIKRDILAASNDNFYFQFNENFSGKAKKKLNCLFYQLFTMNEMQLKIIVPRVNGTQWNFLGWMEKFCQEFGLVYVFV